MRKLRFVPEEGSLVEVTCRTLHGRFLLRPSHELNEIIVGALGRAQVHAPVQICAFAFLSNHYHLLLWVRDASQLAAFMNQFNSKLAREAGRIAGWREKIWSRRYEAILVSQEPAAQVERLRYVLAHGCKEGLVERLRDWPGVHAVRALLDDEPLTGYWFDRTRECLARRRGETHERLKYATRHALELVPLPCWQHLSPASYRERIAEMVDQIERATAAERSGLLALGAEIIHRQKHHDRPERPKCSPAPFVHAASRKVRHELYQAYRTFHLAFRAAAERLQAGEREVDFPPGSFPPALPFVSG